jgi:hypothetical protein
MQTLIIKDLSIAADLDSKSMAAVRGGTYGDWKMPSYMPTVPSYEHPTYPASSSTTTVSIAQANDQCQSNPTGNGSAVFGGGIHACNNQQGFNVIGY